MRYTYDAKGNLLTDGVNSYSYDYEDRQTGMTGPGGTAEYVYDVLGQRVAGVVDGVTTYYLYNLDYQVIEERDAGDSLLARFVYGSGLDETLAMERGGATYVLSPGRAGERHPGDRRRRGAGGAGDIRRLWGAQLL